CHGGSGAAPGRARGGYGHTALTSILPNLATGCAEATWTASSRLSHSSMSYPQMISLVSANGPSLTRISPSRTSTVLASSAGRSRSPCSRMPRAITSWSHGKLPLSPLSATSAVSRAPGTSSSAKLVASTQTSIMYFMSFSHSLVAWPRPGRRRLHHHDEQEPAKGHPAATDPRQAGPSRVSVSADGPNGPGSCAPGRTRPFSYAKTTACTRSRRFSLASTLATCDLTVDDSTTSCAAISALDRPRASSRSTPDSRAVSAWSSGPGEAGWANCSISRRVLAGAS